jgi:integrase
MGPQPTAILDKPCCPAYPPDSEKESRPAEGESMASIYFRGNMWWSKHYENGRMVRQSLKTRDKREARRRLQALEAQTSLTMGSPPLISTVAPSVTWETAAQDLLDYYRAYSSRNGREAEGKVRQLTGYVTGWKLADIDAAAILSYVAHRKRQGRAAATINVELATLKRALRLAKEHKKLSDVPVIRLLRPAPPRSGFFDRDQFEAVAQAFPVDLALVVRVAYLYGWRIDSEVLTLTRQQVDLDAGTLRLEPGLTKNRDGRLVYLTPELKVAFAEQLARVTSLERELSRAIPYVFPTPYGPHKGQRRKDFVKAWRRACRESGCPGRLKHDLRRTAARNMVHLGVSERVVMTVMGHKTRSMLDRYHIVSPSDL